MQEIKDIELVVSTLMERLSFLENKVLALEQENSFLRYRLHQSELENKRLKKQLSKYESPKKDSHNSHIPPSQEDISSAQIRRTRSLREKSGKRSGGQPGHKGNTLEFTSTPDRTESHAPSYCPRCGESLESREGTVLNERWSIDIPPVKPELTLHRVLSRQCSCGCTTCGEFPSHVRGFVSYGVNLRATMSYLNTEHHIPYKRLSELSNDLFNIQLSQGTLYNILKGVKNASNAMYEQIRDRIKSSSVVGADETGCHISGSLNWFWSFQTDKLTYVYPDKSRGKAAIDKHFDEGLPDSWLVTDRHASYFNMDVKGHQLCLAHLIRELTYLEELAPKEPWPKKMRKLFQEAIHKRKTEEWERIDRGKIIERFEKLLFQCVKNAHDSILALQKSLVRHRDHAFRILFNPDIPYDNNASERSIRPLKLKQKVSGGFRSDLGAQAYAMIHSIADTARKNGQSPFGAIKTVIQTT